MVRLVGRLLKTPVPAGVLLALAAWQGWMLVRPRPYPLDDRRRAMADEAATDLARKMPSPASGRPNLAVARFEGDSTGFVTVAVRRAIDRRGQYAVKAPGVLENLLKRIGLEKRGVPPERVLQQDLGKVEADYVLAGRVEKLAATEVADEAALTAVLLSTGGTAGAKRIAAEARRVYHRSRMGRAVSSYPWPARLITWAGFALLLPLALVSFTARGLAMDSNAVNLAMLAGLTLASALAAWAMLGFTVDTWWAACLLVLAVAAALAYNWFLLGKQEDFRQ